MAAYEIKQHFKGLRVETGRRKGRRDPFSTGFSDDDDSEEEKARSRRRERSNSVKNKQQPLAAPAAQRSQASGPAAKTSILDQLRDSDDDDFLNAPTKKTDRGPSPAPAQLTNLRTYDRAGRRGSIDTVLPSINKAPRSARAQAAGTLAYLDDSEDEEWLVPSKRNDRRPSPAPPRKASDSVDPLERSSTPRGSREPPQPPKEQSQTRLQPSRHTVASPFAGTKYLQDSDSDEDAVISRQGSADSTTTAPTDDIADVLSPYESALSPNHPEVKRVDKAKSSGSGVSWRAFSTSRTEQRNTELEALQASLKQRGKSIAFGKYATTDDGKRVPIPAAEQDLAGSGPGRGRGRNRGKSPPRRSSDIEPTPDEVDDGEPERAEVCDPREYKSNPLTGM